jgi:hypothetical protein
MSAPLFRNPVKTTRTRSVKLPPLPREIREWTKDYRSRKKEPRNRVRFVSYVPRKIPPGWIVVHNHVRPNGFPILEVGDGGFRVFLARPDADVKYIRCGCGWAPLLETHYRVKGINPTQSMIRHHLRHG